jgi:hypothetical protein
MRKITDIDYELLKLLKSKIKINGDGCDPLCRFYNNRYEYSYCDLFKPFQSERHILERISFENRCTDCKKYIQ